MPTVYRIIVQNDRQVKGNYAIFNAPPTVDNDGSSPTVYTNAWVNSFIPAGGNTTINTTEEFYAWTGTVPTSPAPGVTIQTGSSAPAQLGTTDTPGSTFPMAIEAGVPVLGPSTLEAGPGAYQITTAAGVFPVPNDTYLVGLGKVSPEGIVAPVASTLADNNTICSITPIMKFYIGTSSVQAGTIVNFKNATKAAGLIDFSSGKGLGRNTAVVRHTSTGAFTVQYMGAAATREVLVAVKNGTLGSYLQMSNEVARLGDAAELKKALEALSRMLIHLNNNTDTDPSALDLSWVGTVSWPATIAIAIVITGAAAISGYLVSRNYSVSLKYTTNLDGSTTVEFTITAPSRFTALIGTNNVDVDWTNAVAADKQNDNHQNQGIVPLNPSSGSSNGGFTNPSDSFNDSGLTKVDDSADADTDDANNVKIQPAVQAPIAAA